MYRFLKHTVKIISLTLLLMYILDLGYSYVIQAGTPRNKIQKILQLENKHYNYIFLGSSRTENHIDCELIENLTGKSCINFGISGGSIGDMLVIMQLAKFNKVSFDKIFLEVDYNYNSAGLSRNFKATLVPFANHSIVKEVIVKEDDYFLYNYVPFYRYMKNDKVVGFREMYNSLMNNMPANNIDVGFSPKIGVGNKVNGNFPEKLNEENKEISRLIELQTNKRNIIFFTAPYCPLIKNRNIVNGLSSKLDNFYNYVSIFDENEEYYFNCGHLNFEGAQKFTRILIRDLKL